MFNAANPFTEENQKCPNFLFQGGFSKIKSSYPLNIGNIICIRLLATRQAQRCAHIMKIAKYCQKFLDYVYKIFLHLRKFILSDENFIDISYIFLKL